MDSMDIKSDHKIINPYDLSNGGFKR